MNSLYIIASAIQNHISAGLKGTNNEPYSVEQIIDEILVSRAAIIKAEEDNSRLDSRDLVQSISCIELDCENISLCCNVETYNMDRFKHFKMPKPAAYVSEPIKYIGLVDRSMSFNIVKGSTWDTVDYSKFNKYIKPKPKVWIHPNREDGFIIDPPTEDLKYITIDFIPENPTDLYQYACCPINNFEDDAKTIPNWMVDTIMNNVISRFTKTMYWTSAKRNDGTGH